MSQKLGQDQFYIDCTVKPPNMSLANRFVPIYMQNDKEKAAHSWLELMEIELPEKETKATNQKETVKTSKNDNLGAVSSLEDLRSLVENFDGCALKKGARNTVFSDGAADAKIMLIGEAPGEKEDARGIPFCGESGKLLDNMMRAIGLARGENIYITNTVFWRPPGNRDPSPQEIAACRPFVQKHIALIAPKLIIAVGRIAAGLLLDRQLKMAELRRTYHDYTNPYMSAPTKVTGIYHPAYLLRSPMQKKTAWLDLLNIEDFIKKNIWNH